MRHTEFFLLFLIASCLCIAACVLSASSPKLIPRSLLFGNPEKVQPQISPDGKALAYLAPSGGALNLWVRILSEKKSRVITHEIKRGLSNYFWASDSKHLFFLQDQNGNENTHTFEGCQVPFRSRLQIN